MSPPPTRPTVDPRNRAACGQISPTQKSTQKGPWFSEGTRTGINRRKRCQHSPGPVTESHPQRKQAGRTDNCIVQTIRHNNLGQASCNASSRFAALSWVLKGPGHQKSLQPSCHCSPMPSFLRQPLRAFSVWDFPAGFWEIKLKELQCSCCRDLYLGS